MTLYDARLVTQAQARRVPYFGTLPSSHTIPDPSDYQVIMTLGAQDAAITTRVKLTGC